MIILFKISIIDNFDKIKDPNEYYEKHKNYKIKIIYKDLTFKDFLIFLKHSAPEVKVEKRSKFGFKSLDNENLCWTEISCHPYSDVEIFKNYFGYNFFRKFNN